MMPDFATVLHASIAHHHARNNKGKLLSVLAGEWKHLKEGNSLAVPVAPQRLSHVKVFTSSKSYTQHLFYI
jgi:hypothetical protein